MKNQYTADINIHLKLSVEQHIAICVIDRGSLNIWSSFRFIRPIETVKIVCDVNKISKCLNAKKKVPTYVRTYILLARVFDTIDINRSFSKSRGRHDVRTTTRNYNESRSLLGIILHVACLPAERLPFLLPSTTSHFLFLRRFSAPRTFLARRLFSKFTRVCTRWNLSVNFWSYLFED